MFDGHAGGSFTSGRFDDGFVTSRAAHGGGFRNFRPVVYRQGVVAQRPNAEVADHGDAAPFEPASWCVRGQRVGYHAWVRASVAPPRALTARRTPETPREAPPRRARTR